MNFYLFLISSITSILGSGIQSIIIPLYVLKVTGSGLEMGKVAGLFTLIPLALSPFGGIISDRFNRKYILIICDLLSFLLLAWFLYTNNNSINFIILMQGLLIAISTFFSSASSAIFAELDNLKNIEINNSLYSGMRTFTGLFIPIIGLTLFNVVDLKTIFFINCITFLISAIIEVFIKYKNNNYSNKKVNFNFFKEYIPIFKYLKKYKNILSISFYGIFLNFFFNPIISIIMPFFIVKTLYLNSYYVGYFESLMGAGLVIGNIIIGKCSKKYNFKKKIIIFIIIRMTIFILIINMDLLVNNPIFIFINGLLIFIEGIMSAFVNTPIFSYLHKEVENSMKGRFFSLFGIVIQSMVPLGLLIFGKLIDLKINIRFLVIISSFTIIFLTYFYFQKTSFGSLFLKDTEKVQ